MEFFQELLGPAWPAVWTLVKIIVITVPLMLGVAYLTFAERKVIGYMQVRIGPNRVGPKGWLQPIADALKLLTKEIIVPREASMVLYLLARDLGAGKVAAALAMAVGGSASWLLVFWYHLTPDAASVFLGGLVFLLALLRTVTARLRIEQMVTFCWKFLAPAALFQILLSLVLNWIIRP